MIKITKITLKLNIPKEILDKVNLDEIAKKLEEEIMQEYTIRKLFGIVKEKDIRNILLEVEEEWGHV